MKGLILPASIAFFLLAACTSTVVVPSETTLDKARKTYPDVTLAQLNEGRNVFKEHCKDCHSYKVSTSKSAGKLGMEVPTMVKKVNHNKEANTITPEKQEALLRYLTTISTFTGG